MRTHRWVKTAVAVCAVTLLLAAIATLLEILWRKSDSTSSSSSSEQTTTTGSSSPPFPSPSNLIPSHVSPSTRPTLQPNRNNDTDHPPGDEGPATSFQHGFPTNAPSLTPTNVTSSDAPSNMPSLRPSLRPRTFAPFTFFIPPPGANNNTNDTIPSDMPSQSPTSEPTLPEIISPDFVFRLKMHWQPDFRWQETTDEYQWCVECTTCRSLTDTYDGDHECEDTNGGDDPTCYEGDQLWVVDCNGWEGSAGNAQFNLLQGMFSDMFRVAGTDLCLSRPTYRYLNLQTCNTSDTTQWFGKVNLNHPFDIRYYQGHSYDKDRCMTQHHHPSKYEVFRMEGCEYPYNDNTHLFEALY